jgi:HPt (histidine-containing phosphotransfer) domain-containing protein
MMGDDFVIDILQTYLDNSKTLLAELKSSLQAQDAPTFARAAHTLNSNSAMLGANTLAEHCLTLEKAGKAAQINGLQSEVENLEKEHTFVCAQIKQRLSGGEA